MGNLQRKSFLSFLACFAIFISLPFSNASLRAQSPSKGKSQRETKAGPKENAKEKTADPEKKVRDFHSPHFLVHSDISPKDAEDLLKRLETMLKLVVEYWGRPSSGILECWVVDDLKAWPEDAVNQFDPEGLARIEDGGGLCIGHTRSRGNQFIAKARIYAVAKEGIPLHEAVHGYCAQSFGRTGPRWYAEGTAEMGNYWTAGERGVDAYPVVIKYLRSQKPRSAESLIDTVEKTGGTWKEYAWWWSLSHFLQNNPNYSAQFRAMGLELLAGKKTGYKEVFGPRSDQVEFEYLFFLEHLEKGFREDLCGWDWKKKFLALKGSETSASATIKAAWGWQPSGATLKSGAEYEYKTTGNWQTGKNSKSVSADGNAEGLGRLEGVMMKDFILGEPFDLGAAGTFVAPSDGDLYLRCKCPWIELPNNSGKINIRIKPKTGKAG